MAKKIAENWNGEEEIALIAVSRGDYFYTRFMLPISEAESLVEIKELPNDRGCKLVMKVSCLLVVDGLHKSLRGAKHIRFIRRDRKSDGLKPVGYSPKVWPRMRVALIHSGVKPAYAIGGFERAAVYPDEVAIPNYSMSGAYGWIIRRRDIEKHLSALPPLKDSGEIGSFWIDNATYTDDSKRGEFVYLVASHAVDPIELPPPDWSWGRFVKREIHRVQFDKGSLLVKKIFLDKRESSRNDPLEEEVGEVEYSQYPYCRVLKTRDRVPPHIREKIKKG